MSAEISKDKIKAKPFLRWAGGKRWLSEYVNEIMPKDINTYHEPFLGGGSIFFGVENIKNAKLSDLNSSLINSYEALRDDATRVIECLTSFKNTKEDYYAIRAAKYRGKYQKAAQFIYLNQTSFNGIYRVNREGQYNVPYGYRSNLDLINIDNLFAVSRKLQNTELSSHDFGHAISKVKKNDFVYLDPPYTVAHENNGFIEYNQRLFLLKDQKRLATWLNKINERGAYYVLSNAKHFSIADIYKNTGNIKEVTRHSLIGGKGAKRELITEYVITNIP